MKQEQWIQTPGDSKKICQTPDFQLQQNPEKGINKEDLEQIYDETKIKLCAITDKIKQILTKESPYLGLQFLVSYKQVQQILFKQICKNIPNKSDQSFEILFKQAQEQLQRQSCQNKLELIQNLRQGVLIKYKDYSWENPRKFLNYLKSLQSLPLYRQYKLYLNRNFNKIKQNFRNYLLSELIKKNSQFTADQIHSVITQFSEYPLFNFYQRNDLSTEQKQILFDICWKSEQIKQYALVFSTPKTLKSQVQGITENMVDFMIENGYIHPRQIQTAIEAIKNFDPNKFFSINSVANSRKNVLEQFTKKAGKYYFYKKQINNSSCYQSKRIQFICKIRQFLHSKSIHPHLYGVIQDILVNNRLIQLWKIPLSDKNTRKQILEFYQKQDRQYNYTKILSERIPIRIKVQAQLQSILMGLVRDLSYGEIVHIVNQFIRTRILPTTKLNQDQEIRFNEQYEKSQFSRDYIDNFCLDIQQAELNLYQRMVYQFGQVAFESIQQVIKNLISNCDFSLIDDSQNLSPVQKKYIKEKISHLPEYQNYKDIYQKIKSKRSKYSLKKLMIQKFGPNGSILFDYLWINRVIIFDKEGKITPSTPSSQKVDTIITGKQKLIVEIQQNNEDYINFQKGYDFLINQHRKYLELKLSKCIHQILYQNNIRSTEYLKLLQENHFNLQILPDDIKNLIKIRPIYKQYFNLDQGLSRSSQFRGKYLLNRYIDSIKQTQILERYTAQERNQVLRGVIIHGLKFLNDTRIIRDVEKNKIKETIMSSKQWEACYPKKVQQLVEQIIKKQHQQQVFQLREQQMKPLKQQQLGQLNPLMHKSLDDLTNQFITKLKDCPDFPTQINNQKIKININPSMFDNLKEFVKNIGITGLMNIKKVENGILTQSRDLKQMLNVITQLLTQESGNKNNSKQKSSLNSTEKIQSKVTSPTNLSPVRELKPTKQELYQRAINIIRSCPGCPAKLSEQNVKLVLNAQFYDKLKQNVKKLGVGLLKVNDALSYMQTNKDEMMKILVQI